MTPDANTLIEQLAISVGRLEGLGAVLATLTPPLLNGLAGVVAGALVLAVVSIASRGWRLANN